MEKIKRLKLSPIFEAAQENTAEGTEGKVVAVSIGSAIEVRKAEGTSALYIESTPTKGVRYNKIEEKDLEIITLHNELAGVVGQFDSSVHKLMARYGYEWVAPATATAEAPEGVTNESRRLNENRLSDPQGEWQGDFLVIKTVPIGKVVDAIMDECYDFGDTSNDYTRCRSIVAQEVKDDADLTSKICDVGMDGLSDLNDAFNEFIDAHQDTLDSYEDYRIR